MIIAVDGPTASGKGTLARALAAHYRLPHLDTGLLYRAVGRQVFLNGGSPDNAEDALAATGFPGSLLLDPELRSSASRIAVATLPIRPVKINTRLYRIVFMVIRKASGEENRNLKLSSPHQGLFQTPSLKFTFLNAMLRPTYGR